MFAYILQFIVLLFIKSVINSVFYYNRTCCCYIILYKIIYTTYNIWFLKSCKALIKLLNDTHTHIHITKIFNIKLSTYHR